MQKKTLIIIVTLIAVVGILILSNRDASKSDASKTDTSKSDPSNTSENDATVTDSSALEQVPVDENPQLLVANMRTLTQAQATARWGKPDTMQALQWGNSWYFANGIELHYRGEQLAQVHLRPPSIPQNYTPSLLNQLGFTVRQPEQQSDESLRWQTIGSAKELAVLFKPDQTIDYVVVIFEHFPR